MLLVIDCNRVSLFDVLKTIVYLTIGNGDDHTISSSAHIMYASRDSLAQLFLWGAGVNVLLRSKAIMHPYRLIRLSISKSGTLGCPPACECTVSRCITRYFFIVVVYPSENI